LAGNPKSEYLNPKQNERNLKKQSQFAVGQIGVSSYLKGYYDKIPLCGSRKNKANQTQFQFSPQIYSGGRKIKITAG